MFGVYSASADVSHQFLCSERKGGKGANEVISMLHFTLKTNAYFEYLNDPETKTQPQDRVVTEWCDNCGGQNKTSFVVWYLLFLVEFGVLREAHLKFFTKGHTKNHCDRSFGQVKRHLARVSCWNMESFAEAASDGSVGNDIHRLEELETPFRQFKEFLGSLYNKQPKTQSYQILSMSCAKPEDVFCRRMPSADSKWVKLSRKRDESVPTTFVEL
ncbi:hypothetical protein BBJ28_00016961 [Nothophytophthora sp. Chile5]|nr:hypothetical protein BBJ28_00016961 [Nothophytophthora sp. Chile5]